MIARCRSFLRLTYCPCSPLEFELDDAPAIEALLAAYPDPVKVADLPHPPTDDLEDKVSILVHNTNNVSKTETSYVNGFVL